MPDGDHNAQHHLASDQKTTGPEPTSTSINPLDTKDTLPEHWKAPDRPILKLIFHTLCLVSLARLSLEEHWQVRMNPDLWEKHKESICSRLRNTNLIGGLILSTSAVFLSTSPPLPSLLPYTATPSYLLTLISLAHALGGTLTGGVIIFVYEGSDMLWATGTLTSSRFRLYATLILLAWPGLSLALSLLSLMLSLILAAFMSGLGWLQGLTVLEILSWAWLPPIFIWSAVPQSSWEEIARKVGKCLRSCAFWIAEGR